MNDLVKRLIGNLRLEIDAVKAGNADIEGTLLLLNEAIKDADKLVAELEKVA